MSSAELPILRLEPFSWMREEGTQKLMAALKPARFVGGAVRDALLNRAVSDIDIATPISPQDMIKRLQKAGITVIPTGLAHGTVTAVLPPRQFEITTLRRDVETDGRHARVEFTDDWVADARRRDFTMNALYLDMEGNLFDPVNGIEDLRAGHVRFVGDPAIRIREDVLRILRFYRFHALYGQGEADAAAREACRTLASLLPTLSSERVAAELLKLLSARDPVPTLRLMKEDGVLADLLPEARNLDRIIGLLRIETVPDPVRRLAALVSVDREGAVRLAERLRLSNAMRARLEAIAAPNWPIDLGGSDRRQRRAIYRLGHELYRDLIMLSGDAARAPRLLAYAEGWQPPEFPLKGRDLIALGVVPGPELGKILAAVEAWWEAGDFAGDRQACLAEAAERLRK